MYNPSPIPKGQIACIPCVVALCEEVCIITVVSPTLRRRCIYLFGSLFVKRGGLTPPMQREGGEPQGSALYIYQKRLPTASVEKRIGGGNHLSLAIGIIGVPSTPAYLPQI